ncbi:hypothetical protein ACFOEK_18815 [Litoribrevibacter euphylliae]|uniref:Glycosyltransferase 2-like domain-containing protein n=1 Tax=Litoribrevibacter euphylliae TaxID=1834034 RepID=A0ABV7HKX6_9GAMM
MITKDNLLICIFSYNQDKELSMLLSSMKEFASGYDCIVYDDGSTNSNTISILKNSSELFKEQFLLPKEKKTSSRGRLHQNIQSAYEYALEKGYQYLFLVQDDMQFVRPLDRSILNEYSTYFDADEKIIQVDPRFLRRLGSIKINNELHAYSFEDDDDRGSYADVGILDIKKLNNLNWKFEASERKNKVKAHNIGLKRIFPFTPIFMHLPYPVIYRKGKKKNKFPYPFVKRGHISYKPLSKKEIKEMDGRDLSIVPYARDILTPKGLNLAFLHYKYANEGKIFS